MKLIYSSQHAKAYLTTEHSASSYGMPVLVVDGQAYRPGNILPSGNFAGDLVMRFQNDDDPGAGQWHQSKEALDLAELFLKPCRGPLKENLQGVRGGEGLLGQLDLQILPE